MKLSTKTKFTMLFVAALGLLAAATGGFTTVSVNGTLQRMLGEGSANAVHLSANILNDRYQNYFNLKLGHALQIQKMMDLYERIITEQSYDGRGAQAVLQNIALPDGMSLWALNEKLTPILVIGSMPAGVNPYDHPDVKGREIGEKSLRLSRRKVRANALVEVPVSGRDVLRYYGHHFYLPQWEVMIGLWTDVEAQEKLHADVRTNAINAMQESFQRVRIGPSGFLFITDDDGNLIVHPENWDLTGGAGGGGKIADLPGRPPLMDRVRESAAHPDAEVRTFLSGVGKGVREAVLHVDHFKPYNWYVVGVSFVDEIRAPGRKLTLSLLGVILASTCGLVLVAMYLIKRMTRPLVNLTRYAKRLPETDFLKDEGHDEVLRNLSVNRQGDEIEELSKAFMFMDGELRSRVRELVESTGVRERIVGELQAATEIQMGILPQPMSEEMSGGRFSMAASLIPAREVGGDLYDYFLLDDGRLCLTVGDVSGKGVPAALFMAMATVLIRACAKGAEGPEEILSRVNANLSVENPNSMFVTLFTVFFEPSTGRLVYSNAGHNRPLIRGVDGSVRHLAGAGGCVAGIFGEAEYGRAEECLAHGETLFLYTDGLTEAMNGGEELFGDEAMERVFAGASGGPEEVLGLMGEAVREHVSGAPASDDLTMLCLRYL